jgi:drug/metabolite transporter (DMT)-like permease
MTSLSRDTSAPAVSSWLPAFAAVALIWGTSFMFIKIAVAELAPVYLALGRIGLGALTLVGILALRRQTLPVNGRLWLHLFLFAVFGSTVPFALFGYAEQRVSSVLAGIWNGTVPLTTLVVTLLLFWVTRSGERPSRQQLVGLLFGFVGVLVVLGVWHGVGGSSFTGQLLLLAAVTCYGIAFSYARWIMSRWSVTSLQLSAGQTLMSTLHLLVVAPLVAGAPPAPSSLSIEVLGSVAALGVLGTGVAFALNFHVVRVAGVTTGSMVTYLPPVVAAAAGVVVLGEHLTWNQPVGGLVVLAGVGAAQGLLRFVPRGLPRRGDVDQTVAMRAPARDSMAG